MRDHQLLIIIINQPTLRTREGKQQQQQQTNGYSDGLYNRECGILLQLRLLTYLLTY